MQINSKRISEKILFQRKLKRLFVCYKLNFAYYLDLLDQIKLFNIRKIFYTFLIIWLIY